MRRNLVEAIVKEHNNCSEASKSLVYARQDSLNIQGEFWSFLSKPLLKQSGDASIFWLLQRSLHFAIINYSLVVLPKTKVRISIGKFCTNQNFKFHNTGAKEAIEDLIIGQGWSFVE